MWGVCGAWKCGDTAAEGYQAHVPSPHTSPHLLQGGTVPQDLLDCVDAAAEGYQTHVLEDEQAELFCCWAESVMLKLWCVLHGRRGIG